MDWKSVINCFSIEEAVTEFSNIFSEAVSRHSVEVTVSRSKFTIQPWMTPGLLKCSRQKDKLHLESRNYPTDPMKKLVYTRYRNFYIILIRKVKAECDSNSSQNT